jgi:hypothetical protein
LPELQKEKGKKEIQKLKKTKGKTNIILDCSGSYGINPKVKLLLSY